MLKLILVMMLGWSIGLAWSEEPDVTLFIDGVEIEIPDNKQVILVPAHWTLEEIYREAHRAQSPLEFMPAGTTIECATDVLVISPASCPE